MYECSLERMTDKIKTMSQFGDAGHGGITRYSLLQKHCRQEVSLYAAWKRSELRLNLMIWRTYMQHFLEVNQIFLES